MSTKREDSWEARQAAKAKARAAERARAWAEAPEVEYPETVGYTATRNLEDLIDEAVENFGWTRVENGETWVNAESLPAIIEAVSRSGYFSPVAFRGQHSSRAGG
jgi:hypothetical protein